MRHSARSQSLHASSNWSTMPMLKANIFIRIIALALAALNFWIFFASPIGSVPVMRDYFVNRGETRKLGKEPCRICGRPGEPRMIRSTGGGMRIVECGSHQGDSPDSAGLMLLFLGFGLMCWAAFVIGIGIFCGKFFKKAPIERASRQEWRKFIIETPVYGVLIQVLWWVCFANFHIVW